MLAIFLKPLILCARSACKIKGFKKMAKVLSITNIILVRATALPFLPQELCRLFDLHTQYNFVWQIAW